MYIAHFSSHEEEEEGEEKNPEKPQEKPASLYVARRLFLSSILE